MSLLVITKMLLGYNVKPLILLFTVFYSCLALSLSVQDPTKPNPISLTTVKPMDNGEKIQADPLHLQGIMIKKGSKLAIISGQLYSKGDKVDGYQIREIHDHYVVMDGLGTQKRLYVYE